jgi:hypothetical protein
MRRRHDHLQLFIRCAAAIAVAACAVGTRAAEVAVETARTDDPQFIRLVSKPGKLLALEVAARRFERIEGDGPAIDLVSAVHIGEASYYAALQAQLEQYDIVLYESVKPAGAGGAGGATHEERVESTEASLGFIAQVVGRFRGENDRYPEDAEELRAFAAEEDPRLVHFLDTAMVDAWGNAVVLVARPDGAGLVIRSLGEDGRPGGEEAEADLETDVDPEAVVAPPAGDGLQAQLAAALNLAFQLDAIDYGREHYRCSDMAMDQVERALRERGSDFSVLEQTLAGSSLPAQLVRVLLGLLRFADTMTDGAMSDMFKVLLMEMLSDERQIQAMMQEFDPGLGEVIIGERNAVVVDDLQALLDADDAPESIGVFYGAGHMDDLATRLEALGYEAGDATWFRAIEVDVANSAVSREEIARMRLMVRRMMRQMRTTR